jgi:hypothetical protein
MLEHIDKVTELEAIRFPTPIKGSCTLKRVQVAPRVNEDNDEPRYYYVRVYVKGRNERIACTTDEATACRFADMALWYAQRFSKKKRQRHDFNYSLEQVLADVAAVPQAVELLDRIFSDRSVVPAVQKTFALEQRVAELEKRLTNLELRVTSSVCV